MPRTRIQEEGPSPVDIHVGARVKNRRLMLGLSQEALAQLIGLTFQQVQKYERGTNRISVSRLMDIAKALRAPIDYFLEGVAASAGKKPALKGVSDNKQATLEGDITVKRDVLELVRAYQSIKAPELKKQLLEMAKAMSKNDAER
jgi:transcriptional regulator with XRE-family HTH domain